MPNALVFMFSGQGSHYYQMGRELYEDSAVFRQWMQRGDDVLRSLGHTSILEELYSVQRKKSDVFDRIACTHPALFMVEYALARLMLEMGFRPSCLLGASLGEIVAAAVAGCVRFEDALALVAKHGEYLQRRPPSGGMLAVLAPPALYESTPLLARHTTLSGVNFDSHFVVSGASADLDRAEARLRELSVNFQRLAVTQAFHSSGIDDIHAFYMGLMERMEFRPPAIPIISCARAEVIQKITPEYLWDVIRAPIRFQETIRKMEQRGGFTYADLGPSGTLATFVKYNLAPGSGSKTFATLTPFGQDMRNVERLRQEAHLGIAS